MPISKPIKCICCKLSSAEMKFDSELNCINGMILEKEHVINNDNSKYKLAICNDCLIELEEMGYLYKITNT